MICSRAIGVGLAVALLGPAAAGAPPALDHLYPAAGQQGTTASVTASGKFDPWPPQAWVDAPGITFKPTDKSGNFEVEIAREASPGPHLVRLFNAHGVSAPRFFIVSREPELRDTEPNDFFKSGQKIDALPATISGRLDKQGDVDCFAVKMKRDQTLVAWLEGGVLASAFDGMLRIVDANGTQVGFNHDGRTFDPFLAWEAPEDGTFVVQVMGFVYPASADVRLTGGDGCVYRLHITRGPLVHYTWPLAAQRGKKTILQLLGWNLTSSQVEFDGTQVAAQTAGAEAVLPGVPTVHPLTISDVNETTEQEQSSGSGVAQSLDIPSAVTGRISSPDDEDRYAFTAVKDRTYELRLTSASIGSPLDAWMKIENNDGKELARSDDAGGSLDPQLTWTAPSEGIFTAAVGELTHRGGSDFVYRLAILEANPFIAATVATHFFSVSAGKTSEIKLGVKRANGFQPKLELAAKNLPEGVSAPAEGVPEKAGEVIFKLSAEVTAKPASQPFQLVLRETETGKEHPVRYGLTASSEDNGVPQGYSELVIDSTDQLWLTVLAP